MTRSLLLFLSLTLLTAGEPGPDPAVVTIDGETITLRELENELLAREGLELAIELVREHAGRIDWTALGDRDPVLALGGWQLSRERLATELLRQHADGVIKELIAIHLVEQALRREGVVVGDLLLDREEERYRRRFAERLAAEGLPDMPFADYLRQEEGMSLAELRQERGFRMAAGLHGLVHLTAEIPEAELKRHFAAHRGDFARPAQVRLRLISLDFRRSPDGQVLEDSIDGVQAIAADLYGRLRQGSIDFEQVWQLVGGAQRDPQAGPGGAIGWVGQDGAREQVGARPLARATVDTAFAADLSRGPALRAVPHDAGVDLILVEARREAWKPDFEAAREEVRAAVIEARMEELQQAIMRRLMERAEVVHGSFGAVLFEREQRLRADGGG